MPSSNSKHAYEKVRKTWSSSANLRRSSQSTLVRETPLTFCPNVSRELGCRIYLKREDLVHGGSHKLNNTLGQALLAKRMGKKRLIAETGAGQHGVATAIVGAALGIRSRSTWGKSIRSGRHSMSSGWS